MQKLFRLSVFFLLFTLGADAKPIDLKEGMWQWSMTMEMMGMKMPAVTYSDCMTQKDLVPQQQKEGEECKVIENSISDNTVRWKIECQSEAGVTTSVGKIVYTHTSAEGEISIENQGMQMKSTISGQYSGPCR